MTNKTSILLVDNDFRCNEAAEAALAAAGYQVRVATSTREAIQAIQVEEPDVIVVGLEAPISEGEALISALHISQQPRKIPTVLLSHWGPSPAEDLGQPTVHVGKPLPADALVDVVQRALVIGRRGQDGEIHPEPALAPAALLMEGPQRAMVEKLNSATVRIQEEERRKLSLELHDDIAQIMGNLVLVIDTCLEIAPPESVQLRRYLANARTTAKEGFGRVQRFSLELRPPMLDDLGLAPTIVWYAERFTRDTEIPVAVNMPDRLPPLNGEQESAIFRIVQEGLHNVRKHAKAHRVTIGVERRAGVLRLEIADDGDGFEPAEIGRKLLDGTHLGLAGMRYRAELLRGTFEVNSAAGRGTQIVVEIPVETGERGGNLLDGFPLHNCQT